MPPESFKKVVTANWFRLHGKQYRRTAPSATPKNDTCHSRIMLNVDPRRRVDRFPGCKYGVGSRENGLASLRVSGVEQAASIHHAAASRSPGGRPVPGACCLAERRVKSCAMWLRRLIEGSAVELIHAVDISPWRVPESTDEHHRRRIAAGNEWSALLAYIDFDVGRHRLGDNWLSIPSFLSESAIGTSLYPARTNCIPPRHSPPAAEVARHVKADRSLGHTHELPCVLGSTTATARGAMCKVYSKRGQQEGGRRMQSLVSRSGWTVGWRQRRQSCAVAPTGECLAGTAATSAAICAFADGAMPKSSKPGLGCFLEVSRRADVRPHRRTGSGWCCKFLLRDYGSASGESSTRPTRNH